MSSALRDASKSPNRFATGSPRASPGKTQLVNLNEEFQMGSAESVVVNGQIMDVVDDDRPVSESPHEFDVSNASTRQGAQRGQPDSNTESFGFASYFGDSGSLQPDDESFTYDCNTQFLAAETEPNHEFMTGHSEYHYQEAAFNQSEDHYQDLGASHYFITDTQQNEQFEFRLSDSQGNTHQGEVYQDDSVFAVNNHESNGDQSESWNQSDYLTGLYTDRNYSEQYAFSYHESDQNFTSTETAPSIHYDHRYVAQSQQHYQDVFFSDVSAAQSGQISMIQNQTSHSKTQNPYRPPEAHPFMTFAFGGTIVFGLMRASVGGNPLTQMVEVRAARPGKIQVCKVVSLIKDTYLEKCIQNFPGPISSSSNISAIGQKQVSSCNRNRLLWQLIDILAANKGLWNREQVTKILTQPGTVNGGDIWLSSSTGRDATATQVSASLKANKQDVYDLQNLVVIGKHVEAAEFAVSKGLWSHALIIALNCEEAFQFSIIQRFRDGFLSPGSPLHTVYSAIAGCPIQLTESWQENLAALFNTKNGDVAITQLGELLAERKNEAAHACFLLSGRPERLLFGFRPRAVFQCFSPEVVQLMECFESSVRQSDARFSIEPLVLAKFSYACLLIDLGFLSPASRYLNSISRSISESTKHKKHLFSEQFCFALKLIDQRLSQYTSRDDGSQSSGVLGSIFNNLSKLLIGKEEMVPETSSVPVISRSSQSNSFEPSTATGSSNVHQTNERVATPESAKDGNIISKLTGFFRNRTPEPGDLTDIQEEEKFEWDPVTKKWISNLTGPPKPVEPPPPVQQIIAAPPPARPNAAPSSRYQRGLARGADLQSSVSSSIERKQNHH